MSKQTTALSLCFILVGQNVSAETQSIFVPEINGSITYEIPDVYCRWPESYEKRQLTESAESPEFKFVSLFTPCKNLSLDFKKLQHVVHIGTVGFSKEPVAYTNDELILKTKEFITGRKKKKGEIANFVTDDGVVFIQEIPFAPILRIQAMKVSGDRLLTAWLDAPASVKDDKDTLRVLLKVIQSIQHSMELVN